MLYARAFQCKDVNLKRVHTHRESLSHTLRIAIFEHIPCCSFATFFAPNHFVIPTKKGEIIGTFPVKEVLVLITTRRMALANARATSLTHQKCHIFVLACASFMIHHILHFGKFYKD